MGLLKKLLKDGSEAAAAVIAAAVVTGADILDNADNKRKDLGRKFDEKALKAVQKVERTRENLAQAFENHVTAFAEALDAAMTEAERAHRKANAPAPQSTVAEVTPEAVAATKPGFKTDAAAELSETVATPKKTRKRAARTTKKPSL